VGEAEHGLEMTMRMLIASALGVLLLGGCAAEKTTEVSASDTTTTKLSPTTATQPVASKEPAKTDSAAQNAIENHDSGTWSGQIKVAQPVSMFNYVGAESGDFSPMRFRNDSEAGKKILAVCSNDDLCEFTGMIEWLDEPLPPDASGIAQILRVDSVKRLPAATP
jgi:PBP1b-binding outer membrane lipoprotein LpoB